MAKAKKKKKDEIEEIPKTKLELAREAMGEINEKLKLDGDSAIKMGMTDTEKMSTGYHIIDTLIGGGIMKGKITVLMGEEKSGKTGFCVGCIAADQRENDDSVWLWLDSENSVDKKWFETLGLDSERIIIIDKKETMEEYGDIAIEWLKKNNLINGIVLDSVGAMMPSGEAYAKKNGKRVEKSLDTETIGVLNRKLGQFLRRVKGPVARANIPLLMATHIYVDINNGGYKIPKGGSALKHFADFRIDFRTGKNVNAPWNVKDANGKEQYLGFEQILTIDKTKNSSSKAPRSQISMPYMYGKGPDEERFFIERAINDGVILHPGAYYYFEENLSITTKEESEFKIHGRGTFWKFMSENPKVRKRACEIYKDVDIFVLDDKPSPFRLDEEDPKIEKVEANEK